MAISTPLARSLGISLASNALGEELATALNASAGFLANAPQSAYTQTAYATANKTVDNLTSAAVVTTAATSTLPFGYSEAQANAIVAAVNALRVDLIDVKQAVNAIIDDMQALGLVG